MRKELSSLDLKFLANELKALVGGVIQKAWKHGKQLRFEIFLSGKGTFELLFEPGKIFITEYRRKAPPSPEAFAMAMRRHMTGQRIVDIRQPGFDRIIEIETERNILVLETFSKGNAILCDKNYKIITPLQVQIWRDRRIVPKAKYQYPPSVANPYELKPERFYSLLQATEKDIVRFLAVDLSFSGLYAEEICARAEVDKKKLCRALSKDEIKKLFAAFHSLLEKSDPRIVFEDNTPIDIVPMEMNIYEGKKTQPFNNFTSALDEYFTHKESVAEQIEKKAVFQAESGKLQHILEDQLAALKKWKRVERESRKKADAIYNNYELVENVITSLQQAREKGISWEDIKKKSKKIKAVKEIREKKGIVVLKLK